MKFTIVIPTLNRADVLMWSIESILNQKGSYDFNIIVSDNKSDDNTKEVIEKLNDKRIKMVQPPNRLSMSRHWEFAAEFVEKNDRNTLVMYLGDDDILSSNAFNIAVKLFNEYDIDALRRTSGYFYTPECDCVSAGYLILPEINGGFEVRNSLQYLEKVASGNVHYGELPNLYHGFVRSNILGELLSKGPLFMKAAPDIFSDINIAAININYGSINYPLTLGVASPKSNGLNFAKNNNISKEYREMSINELTHKYHIDNVNMHVVECLEFVLKKYDLNISIDNKRFYTDIIKYEKIKIIIKIIDSLKILSLKSTSLIILDMLLLLPYKIRNIPFDFNKRLKFLKKKLNINLSKRDAVFSYSGDLRKINISNPKGCIEFIEKNVILKI